VATDDARIRAAVSEAGGEAVMTSAEHRSGSDRIAEVAERLPAGSVIVNVQGDEPMIPAATIEAAVDAMLQDEAADIVTTCERIEDYRDVLSPDTVKVVADTNGYALYFSRSPIPFPRVVSEGDGDLENALVNDPELLGLFRKHTGLYVYRREFLLRFSKMDPTMLERTEMLEQLRAIENGARIRVVEVKESSIGVDSEADFERVRSLMEAEHV
jgi:3-deoxy-manno-octulosonate cytidylyltransferase (CMP-KDO synthetase)